MRSEQQIFGVAGKRRHVRCVDHVTSPSSRTYCCASFSVLSTAFETRGKFCRFKVIIQSFMDHTVDEIQAFVHV
jgi:hypothetical protein